MFAGTALSVRLLVYAVLSLFIIGGPYVFMVVCLLYAYNLTIYQYFQISLINFTLHVKNYIQAFSVIYYYLWVITAF